MEIKAFRKMTSEVLDTLYELECAIFDSPYSKRSF